jgi:hypothetical protein
MNIEEFDYSVDLLQALLWQYNDAINIQGLITSKNTWYSTNQQQFWTDWFNNVFNLETANDFGLAVWSIILQQPLSFGLPPDGDKPIFGLGPFTNNNVNFNNGTFSIGGNPLLVLTTAEKRLILQLRYFQLVTRGAVTEVNAFLKYVFNLAYPTADPLGNPGSCYLLDNYNMSISYVFTFLVPKRLLIILRAFDLLPRPAGVGVGYIVKPIPLFGFGPFTNGYKNFGNGCFLGSYI